MKRTKYILLILSLVITKVVFAQHEAMPDLKTGFLHPPATAKPGVYWYFMDGNLSKAGITSDLEAMKKAGINNLIFLEVNVGVPRGKVDFLSDEWQNLFKFAESECRRLNIRMTLGTGPGWTGSGGPWVKPEQSMQILVSSSINVSGNQSQPIKLPLPENKKPYFGEKNLSPELKKEWDDFYDDVAVLAFPAPYQAVTVPDIGEKALYFRSPYSSKEGTKDFLPSLSLYASTQPGSVIVKDSIIDLTNKLLPDGSLNWKVPPGHWTIMRFGRRNNGAVTRPAPIPGLGFESDKFDTAAISAHLAAYTGQLLKKIGPRDINAFGGLKMLHMDSWEMGSQNWTPKFREEFMERRGYDPLPFYPVYAGKIVGNEEITERFLWDLRQTSQELILQNHASYIKNYSHRNGMGLSIEPYDMNPAADLELGNIADVPMCEFWSQDYGFNTSFSVIEAASIAHVNGIPTVPAEAFTAGHNEAWKQYPGSMKNEGDWAFAAGVNRFVFHTFAHQPLDPKLKPGMQMGIYGVHWDRNQTWWPMVNGYHEYVSRCQFMLQQGRAVADILYLTPEGAPNVFRAPSSALKGDAFMPDRKAYNFDACSPGQLYKAYVINNNIVFPGGARYRVLIMPRFKTMTPKLLRKLTELVGQGATIVGLPPQKSPGLSGYPLCDQEVNTLSAALWGTSINQKHGFGKGIVIRDTDVDTLKQTNLYPDYNVTAKMLQDMGVKADFEASDNLRYTHRITGDLDIYFLSNPKDSILKADCFFRSAKGAPQLWNPVNGEIRPLPEYTITNGKIKIPMKFEAYESFFVVFRKKMLKSFKSHTTNFTDLKVVKQLGGPWQVSFDHRWGGPDQVTFDHLKDWTQSTENGIRYYSGIAIYQKQFDAFSTNKAVFLDLGKVKNLARVKLNGKNLGVLWTSPWRVNVTHILKSKGNRLEIEVANLWVNRMIGDEQLPDDGIKNNAFPDWLLQNKPRPTARYTFSVFRAYKKDSPLLESGLLGPVTLRSVQ